MRFLEYLFFKYYNWAIKVGNGEMPATTSVMCISFCILLYVVDIVCFFFFFISPESTLGIFYLYLFILFFIISFVVLYIILVCKGKYQIIMDKHREEWTGKKHWGAVLFPVIAFFIYALELFIKMQINNGFLLWH